MNTTNNFSIYLIAGMHISEHMSCSPHVQHHMLFYHCILMGHDFFALQWLQLRLRRHRSFPVYPSSHLRNTNMHLLTFGSFSEYKWGISKYTIEKKSRDKYPRHFLSAIRWHPTTRHLTHPSTSIHHRIVAHGFNRSCHHHHRVEHH